MSRAHFLKFPGLMKINMRQDQTDPAAIPMPFSLALKFEPQPKLDKSRLIALSTDRAKRVIAPVRVWITPKSPVEQVTHLALEF